MADESAPPAAQGFNFGAAVSETLREKINSMDLVTVLQKMVASTPEDEESEEIREKLQGVLKQFDGMSEEEKASFTAQIKEGLANKLSMKLQDPNFINLGGVETAIKDAIMYRLFFVGAGVLILIILFVFFGYKLFKSIKEKETKREEKKKLKQMKKKK